MGLPGVLQLGLPAAVPPQGPLWVAGGTGPSPCWVAASQRDSGWLLGGLCPLFAKLCTLHVAQDPRPFSL